MDKVDNKLDLINQNINANIIERIDEGFNKIANAIAEALKTKDPKPETPAIANTLSEQQSNPTENTTTTRQTNPTEPATPQNKNLREQIPAKTFQ